MKIIPATQILLPGTTLNYDDNDDSNATRSKPSTLLFSTTPLSFWGGIDPITGRIIDASHPLHTRHLGAECAILAIPGARGSCTTSQVLLELLLNDNQNNVAVAPRGIVLRDVDPVIVVGALVYEEMFAKNKSRRMPIISLGAKGFKELEKLVGQETHSFVEIINGNVCCFETEVEREKYVQTYYNDVDIYTGNEEHECDLRLEENFHQMDDDGKQENNAAYRIAHRILTYIAQLVTKTKVGAATPRLIPVTRAHIDAVTYIGPGGLKFIQTLVDLGGKVCIPTTLNSGSIDRVNWSKLGVPREFGTQAKALGDAYVQLGCIPSFTCAPYLLEDQNIKPGEHIAWGESNAVVYANSVLGARTVKYPDYLEVCASICGVVPEWGVHLSEERYADVILDVSNLVEEILLSSNNYSEKGHDDDDDDDSYDAFFPALGYLCGNMAKSRIPVIIGMELLHRNTKKGITSDDLKAFSAAFGTTAGAPMYHMVGITPEAPSLADTLGCRCDVETIYVSGSELLETIKILDSNHRQDGNDVVDVVALGNPHLSLNEVSRIANLCQGQSRYPGVKAIATLGRQVHASAQRAGYIDILTSFGFQLINDTCWCMLSQPIVPKTTRQIITNSGKYAHYANSLIGEDVIVRFSGLEDCMAAAKTGKVPLRYESSNWITRLQKPATTKQHGVTRRYFSGRSCPKRGAQVYSLNLASMAIFMYCKL